MPHPQTTRTHAARHRPDLGPQVGLAALALAQAGWLRQAAAGAIPTLLGFLLVVLASALAIVRVPQRAARVTMGLVAFLLAVNLVAAALAVEPPVPSRLQLVITVLVTVAFGTASLLAARHQRSLVPSIVVGLLVAVPVIAAELFFSLGAAPLAVDPSQEWGVAPRAGGASGYAPLATTVSRYPDDLGGYLAPPAANVPDWRLVAFDTTNQARIVEGTGQAVRVAIDRAIGKVSWEIQLLRSPVRIRQGTLYRLAFRVRADSRRGIGVVVTLGREPWTPIGLGQELPVDTGWQQVNRRFVASATDSAALLRFDLSTSDVDVEFADVELRESGGVRADLVSAEAYVLPFRFDSLGCRGPVRATNRDDDIVRVLALGDSHTLGAGVLEEDAWPARLEALLNTGRSGDARPVQVFNCGVTGFGTADARNRLAELAPRLQPDVVILGVVLGDHARADDDISLPVLRVGPGDRILRSVLWWRHRRAARAAGAAAIAGIPAIEQEVVRLDSAARVSGARLAVILLQDHASGAWTELVSTIADTARHPGLAVLPMGERLRVFAPDDRFVRPPFDMHLGRTSHRVVAEAAASFLRQREPLSPPVSDSARATPGPGRRPGRGR